MARKLRPAPLPAHLIEEGDLVLTEPGRGPQTELGTVTCVTDSRGTLTIAVGTSPASMLHIATTDYGRTVWVHVWRVGRSE